MRTLPRARLGHRAGIDQVVVGDDLRLDEPALEVSVDHPGGLRRGGPALDRPGARLLRPGGEKRRQAQRREADPGQDVKPRLLLSHGLQQLQRLVRRQLDQLGLRLGVEEDRFGRRDERPQLIRQRGVRDLVRVDVEGIEERLGGHEVQIAQRLGSKPRPEHGAPGFENRASLLDRLDDGRLVLLDAGLLLQPGQGPVDGLEIGEDQLGVHRLDVVPGRDLAVDVDDIRILEHADYLADRVCLADVRQELVAQSGAFARALDEPGYVDERHRGGNDLGRVEHRGQDG